jgi:diguanylate cyclase (GGDEF)-like protein
MSEFAKTLETFMRSRADDGAAEAEAEASAADGGVANDNTPARAEAVAARASRAAIDPLSLRAQLAGLELLRGMGPELLDVVIARCPLLELTANATLLAAGQTNAEIFVVLHGSLNVYLDQTRDVPVAVLRAGDTVGELSAIDKQPTSASVIAQEYSLLLSIDEAMFWHIVHASHSFAVRLMLKLAERLRANNTTVQTNRELRAHFEAVALSDALTGVHSRRWLDETLPRLCERHRFDGQPLSIAVVDVDHFKRINDQYGHQTGDIVLVELAKCMRNRLRPTDFVARFGGEEFVLIFPRTSLAGAAIATERLRESVMACAIKTREGEQLPSTTISIGLAELQAGHDVPRLLRAADEAVYRAKHKGRNRVES